MFALIIPVCGTGLCELNLITREQWAFRLTGKKNYYGKNKLLKTENMNPFKVFQEVKHQYKSYIQTFQIFKNKNII